MPIYLKGSHYNIGYEHGQQLSETILMTVVPFIEEDMQESGISMKEGLSIAKKYELLISKDYPEVMEETKGLADGAGIDFKKALLILFYWEVHDTVEQSIPECSSFVAAGDATVGGEPIASQNSDWPKKMIGRGIPNVFHVSPNSGYSFIGRGLAGNLGRTSVIGFNEKGLGFVGSGINQLNEPGFGFPPLILTRIGLERCSTVEEFLGLVKSIPRWSHAGENVEIVDKHGNMARISFGSSKTFVVQTKDHFLVSTNHFHNQELRHLGPETKESYPSSYERYDRLIDLLKANYGKIDLEVAKQIMSDHKHGNRPPDGGSSICRHGSKQETMGNMIFLPNKRKFWMSQGTPCGGDYSEFKL
ncbi:MAG: C45 family autoproteolytic acyltransferase/hydrolase [Candidatus Thorarchaeota archaeon]